MSRSGSLAGSIVVHPLPNDPMPHFSKIDLEKVSFNKPEAAKSKGGKDYFRIPCMYNGQKGLEFSIDIKDWSGNQLNCQKDNKEKWRIALHIDGKDEELTQLVEFLRAVDAIYCESLSYSLDEKEGRDCNIDRLKGAAVHQPYETKTEKVTMRDGSVREKNVKTKLPFQNIYLAMAKGVTKEGKPFHTGFFTRTYGRDNLVKTIEIPWEVIRRRSVTGIITCKIEFGVYTPNLGIFLTPDVKHVTVTGVKFLAPYCPANQVMDAIELMDPNTFRDMEHQLREAAEKDASFVTENNDEQGNDRGLSIANDDQEALPGIDSGYSEHFFEDEEYS